MSWLVFCPKINEVQDFEEHEVQDFEEPDAESIHKLVLLEAEHMNGACAHSNMSIERGDSNNEIQEVA